MLNNLNAYKIQTMNSDELKEKRKTNLKKQFEIKYKLIDLDLYEINIFPVSNVNLDNLTNTKYVIDIEYSFLKRNIKEWIDYQNKTLQKFLTNYNSACSPDLISYFLPLNLQVLEKMTCITYLSTYCRISNFRQKIINRYFNKYKIDDLNSNCEQFVDRADIIRSICEFHANEISSDHVENMLEFLDLNEKKDIKLLDDKTNTYKISHVYVYKNFNFKEFLSLLAFSEKYFSKHKSIKYQEPKEIKNILEHLDFQTLFKNLNFLNIDKNLIRLLKLIAD